VIQRNRLKYLLKTFLQRFFLNILTCFFATKKLAPYKKILATAFIISSYLLIAGCSDTGDCVEADDFGEYATATVTVPASSSATYCKFDENYELDPFNSLANHGEKMKKCLTATKTNIIVGVESKESQTGCAGYAEKSYKEACIQQCKISCNSMVSDTLDITKPSAEPDWTYTELPNLFQGISISPESQIYITANGTVNLASEVQDKTYYVVPSKNSFHSANLAGQFSAGDSALLLKANEAITLSVSGKFIAKTNGVNRTYGTIYKDPYNTSPSPAFDLSQRLIAYLEPVKKPSIEEIKTYTMVNKSLNLGKYGGKLYYKIDSLYEGISEQRIYEEDYLKDAVTLNSINLSKLNYCFNGNFDKAEGKIITPDAGKLNYNAINKEKLSCVVAIPATTTANYKYSFQIPDFDTNFPSFHIFATKYKEVVANTTDLQGVATFSYYHKFYSDEGNFLPFRELKNKEIVRDTSIKKLDHLSVAQEGDEITIERSDTQNTAPVFIVISAVKHNFVNRIKLNQSGLSSIYNIKGTASGCSLYTRVVNDIKDLDTTDKDDTDPESNIVEENYSLKGSLPTDVNTTNKEFFVRKGQYLLFDWGDVASRANCVDVPLLVNRYRPAAFCTTEPLQTIDNPFCTISKEGSVEMIYNDKDELDVDAIVAQQQNANVNGCKEPSFDGCTESSSEPDFCSSKCLASCSSNSANNNYCLSCTPITSSSPEIKKRSCSILSGTWESNSSSCHRDLASSTSDSCRKCFDKLESYSEMPNKISGSVDYCYNIDNYKKTLNSFRSEPLNEKEKYLIGSMTPSEAGNFDKLSFANGSAFSDSPAKFSGSSAVSLNQDSYLKFLIIGNDFKYGEDNFSGTNTTFHQNITPKTDLLQMSVNVSTRTQNGAFLEARLCGPTSECSVSTNYLKPKIISIESSSQDTQHLTCPSGYAYDNTTGKCKCTTADCYSCGMNETFNSTTKLCECKGSSKSWDKAPGKGAVESCHLYGKTCQEDRWLGIATGEERDNLIRDNKDEQCKCADGYEQETGLFSNENCKKDGILYKNEDNTKIPPKIKPPVGPEIVTETSTGYGVSADSNYFFDDSGVLTRKTDVDSGFDCSVTKTVTKGGDVYCHKNFYYDDTVDSAIKTTKQDQIAKLRLAFRIYDPETKNCKLFSSSARDDGVKIINPNSTDTTGNAPTCYYDIHNQGKCTSQYYCDSVYANNTGFYNVRIKIKDAKTTSSNFVDAIIKKTNEITRGIFKVENDKYVRISPPLFESLYISVIADSTYQGILRICLILFIAFFGTGYFLGTSKLNFQELMMMVFRLAFVMLMVTPGGFTYFNNLFVLPFQQATDYLTFNFAAAFNDSPQIASAIERQDFFDRSILFSSTDDVVNIMISSASRKKVVSLLFVGVFGWIYFWLILLAFFKYMFAIGTTLLIYLTAQVVTSLLFLVAPIVFVMLFFKQTRETFGSWLGSLFSLSLQQIFVIMAISLFNLVAYDLIKMVLGYRVCWDDVWTINIYITRITLLKFWTFSGLAPRHGSNLEPITDATDGFPSILGVFSIYLVAYLAKEFVDISSSIAESIGGSFWGGSSEGGASASKLSSSIRSSISSGINKSKDFMSKVGRFASNQTLGRFRNNMLEGVGYKSKEQINRLNAKQDQDLETSRKMRKAGDNAVSDYKINNANKLADMSAKDKRDTLEQVRNNAVNNFAKDNNIDDKELERLRNFKPKYYNQNGLLHLAGDKLWDIHKGDNRSINDRKIEKSYLTRSEAKKAMDKMSSGERKEFLKNVKMGKIRVDTGLLNIRRNSKIGGDKVAKFLQQANPNGKFIKDRHLSKTTVDRNRAREEVIKDLADKGEISNKKWFQEYSKEDAEKIEKTLEENAPDSYFDRDYFNSADTYKELENYDQFKTEDEKSKEDRDAAKERADEEYHNSLDADRGLGNSLSGKVVAGFRNFKRKIKRDFTELEIDSKRNWQKLDINFRKASKEPFGVSNQENQEVAKKYKEDFGRLLQQERDDARFDRDNGNLDDADLTRAQMRELIVGSLSSERVANEKF
jgi:type IV secretory pathway VirB6-like protein